MRADNVFQRGGAATDGYIAIIGSGATLSPAKDIGEVEQVIEPEGLRLLAGVIIIHICRYADSNLSLRHSSSAPRFSSSSAFAAAPINRLKRSRRSSSLREEGIKR